MLKRLLLENWNLKVTAILIAVVLWLVVHGDSSAERVLTVPLEIRVPRYMEITNERPSTVDVTVRGAVANPWFGQALPTCLVDLQAADEGQHVVPLSPANVRLPRAAGLEVLAVRPARLSLVLERTVSREVPIQVPILGEPAPGFDVYGKSFTPTTTLITGPRSRIAKISAAPTEAVSIGSLRESLRTRVMLDIRDSFVRAATDAVSVTVELGVHRRLQTIARVAVLSDSEGFTLTPPRVTVVALVPTYYRQPLTASDFTATVSAGNVNPAHSTSRVRPLVRFTARSDPSVLIQEVRPTEIVLQRK